MKVILIGASGTIGKAVGQVLNGDGAEVIPVSRTSGNFNIDLASESSIREMFERTGPVDGIICTGGRAYAGPLSKMGEKEAFMGGMSKLMGQVNLVLIGKDHINPGGFITLTSGSLFEEPAVNSAGLGLANGGLNGFVINAALEMPNGIRLNIVSPSVLAESVSTYGESPTREGIPSAEVALIYKRSYAENITGQVLRAYGKLKQPN